MKNLLISFLLFTSIQFAQNNEVKNQEICESKFDFAINENLSEKPINEVIVEIGKSFLGTDYEAFTLENKENEKLIVKLDGLDCYTFLEATLALSRCVKLNQTDFDSFLRQIEILRYRGGKLEGYVSRLHYFSDWIYDNELRNILIDKTKECGGELYSNQVNFMSTHPEFYQQLKDRPEIVAEISLIEKSISTRNYYYIAQENIDQLSECIQSGDLIGITSSIPGLDIAHTGIAIRDNQNILRLLHAPNKGQKVQISKLSLADYIKSNSKQTGIILSRAVSPSE
ncbi:MAG: DUF1460 domain-containing protein [Melioribacteraceae bacterium]|nr:DUF1460 domain-containing protein [Melioribacteraceae bacterium]MCF8264527.1 DUF1460 domain-containing protein [Melioribacteraceae bacterium]MCF8431353.1 DUF1460 domain-containing protein [Melioribacteraceae bacterium]